MRGSLDPKKLPLGDGRYTTAGPKKGHVLMTADFPYSPSCFRGTPVRTGPPGP